MNSLKCSDDDITVGSVFQTRFMIWIKEKIDSGEIEYSDMQDLFEKDISLAVALMKDFCFEDSIAVYHFVRDCALAALPNG